MTIITKANLAAELRISKARVSQYVNEGMPVRSDGKLDRENVLNWIGKNYTDQTGQSRGVGRAHTLVKEQQRPRHISRRAPARYGEPDPLLETLVDGARDWREVRGKSDGLLVPIDVAAAIFAGGNRSAVLTWLRAGLPYAVRGDWETGEGFILVSHWIMHWGLWAAVRADQSGDRLSAHELQLEHFGEAGGWTPKLVAQFEKACAELDDSK